MNAPYSQTPFREGSRFDEGDLGRRRRQLIHIGIAGAGVDAFAGDADTRGDPLEERGDRVLVGGREFHDVFGDAAEERFVALVAGGAGDDDAPFVRLELIEP